MSGSYYTLNSKYNQLKSILAGLPISGSGLTGDLDANNYDILNVDNITLNTINGLPPTGGENLEQTLTIGNDAGGLDITNLNQLSLSGTSTITDSTGDLVIQPPTNQTLQLGNNIYVDTLNNRIGINVPAPEEDLEIDGNIQMDTGSTSKIVFYDKPNDHEHGEIDAEGEGTNGGLIKFQTKIDGGAVSEKLRIDNIGRLGLGGANYGTSGQVLTSNGATAPTWETPVAPTPLGYSFVEKLVFETAGSYTFTKASYPYLRAIKVICIGGGGGGGHTKYLALAGDAAAGTGGAGGTYVESFITDIASLNASVPIEVGAGGAGGVGGTSSSPNGTNPQEGDGSVFGGIIGPPPYILINGGGGDKGQRGDNTQSFYGASGVDGKTGNGDFVVRGWASENSWSVGSIDATGTYLLAVASNGGNSPLGRGGSTRIVRLSTASSGDTAVGTTGLGIGAGGSGGAAATRTAGRDGARGGNGSDGAVWLELYA